MTQFYVGVKIVTAWPEERDGREGYAVKYDDDYISWSPKAAFEKAYLPMGLDATRVNEEMVNLFLGAQRGDCFSSKVDEKTVLVKAETLSGFVQWETSSCVDPANFDLKTGEKLCLSRIKDTLWQCLGFVVQWGRNGLKTAEASQNAEIVDGGTP